MQHIFQPGQFFVVADGTSVAPLLNPFDANATGVPAELLGGASLAVGEIAPASVSQPHLHPLVSQVTWVLSGHLRARMRSADAAPYELDVAAGQAVLTEPMTFLQLANPDPQRPLRLLYVVTPAYVHSPGPDGYEDAVVFEGSWEELAREGFPLERIGDREAIGRRRASALDRLRARAHD